MLETSSLSSATVWDRDQFCFLCYVCICVGSTEGSTVNDDTRHKVYYIRMIGHTCIERCKREGNRRNKEDDEG